MKYPITRRLPFIALAILIGQVMGCSEFIDRDPCGSRACSSGETRCDETGAWKCATVDGCPAWEGGQCETDQVCGSENQCVDLVCTAGDTRCVGNAVELCGSEPGGRWALAEVCDAAQNCKDGECGARTCSEIGARECGDGGEVLLCSDVGETEPELTRESTCGDGQLCLGAGVCGSHACEVGTHECTEEAGSRSCEVGADGFRVWGSASPCADNTLCGNDGLCGAHECGPKGVVGCVDGALATCDADAGGFLVWGDPTSCETGSQCIGDACVPTSCEPPDSRCVDGALQTCEPNDDGGSWSESTACGPDTVCHDGACQPHECAPDERMCSNEHLVTCETTASGLRVWSEATACDIAGHDCRDGQCGQDECAAVGQLECVGNATRTCQDGLFYVWSNPQPCPAQCLAGVCGQDECVPGEIQCTDNLVSGCILDSDGFQVLTEPTPCPDEAMVCTESGCAFEGEFELWDQPTIGRTSVTATAAGGFAAVWAAPQTSSFPVRLGAFAAGGNPLLDPLDVSGPVGVNLPWPTLRTLPSGAIQMAWLNGGTASMVTRRITAAGAFEDPKTLTGLLPLPPSPWPVVVPFGIDESLVVRAEGAQSPSAQRVVFNRVGDQAGPPVMMGLDSDVDELITGIDAAVRSDGGVWVIWAAADQNDDRELRLQAVEVSGVPAENVLTIATDGMPDRPVLASTPDGTVLGAWDDNGAIMVRSMEPLGAVSTIHLPDSIGNSEPSLVSTSSGFRAVWQGPDASDTGIFTRPLQPDGTPAGPIVQLNTTTAGSQAGGRAAVINDGRVVIVWRNSIGQNARVTARIISP